MSENLKMLNEMFPGKLILNPVEIAQALGWDRRRVYVLASQENPPFELKRVGNLICVAKTELAKWLDGGEKPERVAQPQAEEKKKRGRPRRSISAIAFAAQVELACQSNFFVSKMKSVKSELLKDKTKMAVEIIDKAMSESFSSTEYGALSDHLSGDFQKGTKKRPPL